MIYPYFYESDFSIDLTEGKQNHSWTLTDTSRHHCVQVLRLRQDDQIVIINGLGQKARGTIQYLDKSRVTVALDQYQITPHPKAISIGISLLKHPDRLELLIEKITEIGVKDIYLLQCARTEKHSCRFDRLDKIAISAMLQSQQTWKPVLHPLIDFSDFMHLNHHGKKMIAHIENNDTKDLIHQQHQAVPEPLSILIGPEGDFSKDEVMLAKEKGFISVSLGANRLRAETAAIYAISILNTF
ncbi:MAG: RsmE family RNA methyltransferase [Phycisphaerales bacterium]|nr:RsmE family RNA methyltransferase [Phycisphaerales bacterium]